MLSNFYVKLSDDSQESFIEELENHIKKLNVQINEIDQKNKTIYFATESESIFKISEHILKFAQLHPSIQISTTCKRPKDYRIHKIDITDRGINTNQKTLKVLREAATV